MNTSVSSYLGRLHQVLDVEQCVVDPEDDPVEQSAVQRLRHGVSHRPCLKVDTCSLSLVLLPQLTSQFSTLGWKKDEEYVFRYSITGVLSLYALFCLTGSLFPGYLS